MPITMTERLAMKRVMEVNAAMSRRKSVMAFSCSVMFLYCSIFVPIVKVFDRHFHDFGAGWLMEEHGGPARATEPQPLDRHASSL
ncbi:hypothetical protein [Rhizobium sp. SG2393]|uniref:hypothetical protein n=1 Tax=Rhizobium sp. SG2393 TaxID=3276279 RepID=UPI0036724E10